MTDFVRMRKSMVECQIRTNKVIDPAVIAAFEAVPREVFVPEGLRSVAYIDEDLPLGIGRFLMEPMVHARLLQAAQITATDRVMEIGTGCGYGAAILARLARTVVSVESHRGFAQMAADALKATTETAVSIVTGQLAAGAPAHGPYDVIVFAGAVAAVPQAIFDQLADGGRCVGVVPGDNPPAQFSGLKSGGVGHATLWTRIGTTISARAMFNAQSPPLPDFARKPAFVF